MPHNHSRSHKSRPSRQPLRPMQPMRRSSTERDKPCNCSKCFKRRDWEDVCVEGRRMREDWMRQKKVREEAEQLREIRDAAVAKRRERIERNRRAEMRVRFSDESVVEGCVTGRDCCECEYCLARLRGCRCPDPKNCRCYVRYESTTTSADEREDVLEEDWYCDRCANFERNTGFWPCGLRDCRKCEEFYH